MKPIEEMHSKHGLKPGHKCGECRSMTSVTWGYGWRGARTYHLKCRNFSLGSSRYSDWHKRYAACGLYETWPSIRELQDDWNASHPEGPRMDIAVQEE